MTTPKAREGDRVTPAAEPSRSTPDHPVATVHHHTDGRGPFHVAVCPCPWASREFADPSDAEFAKACHDRLHADELVAAS